MGLVDYTIFNEPPVVFLENEPLFDETFGHRFLGVAPHVTRRTHRCEKNKVFKNKEEIQDCISRITRKQFTLTYNETLNKMTIINTNSQRPPDKITGISFYPKLANILGFLPNHNYVEKKVLAPFTFDIYGGFRNIYLYSHILENSYLGDVQSPLLKTIPLIRENLINYNEIINPQYFLIKFDNIPNLHIDIRNEYGEYIEKNINGPTVIHLTLHISPNPYK
jgi:hypothetical protein